MMIYFATWLWLSLSATVSEEVDTTAAQKQLAEAAAAHSAASITPLWLAAFDGEARVREAGLQAVQQRCEHESPSVCTSLLSYYTDDAIAEIAWSARDALLALDTQVALAHASSAYKLDLLTELGGKHALAAEQVGKILRMLASDTDPAVQENAAWLLENSP